MFFFNNPIICRKLKTNNHIVAITNNKIKYLILTTNQKLKNEVVARRITMNELCDSDNSITNLKSGMKDALIDSDCYDNDKLHCKKLHDYCDQIRVIIRQDEEVSVEDKERNAFQMLVHIYKTAGINTQVLNGYQF